MARCDQQFIIPKLLPGLLLFAGFINQATGLFKLIKEFDDVANTLNIRFSYGNSDRKFNHTFRLSVASLTLLECRLQGDRGMEETAFSFYQVIIIPMDFLIHALAGQVPCTVTVMVTSLSSRSQVVQLEITIERPKHVTSDFFNTSIDIYSGGKFIGSATFVKTDKAIPKVSQKARISIKLSKTFHTFHYKMTLYRIDNSAADMCPTEDLGGEINLEEYISIFALESCKLSMDRSELVVQNHAMPFGYIGVTIDVTNMTTRVHSRIHRYFKVEEKIDADDVPFRKITWPKADTFSQPFQSGLFIDMSKSFFPYAQKSFGEDGIVKPVVDLSRSCVGLKDICDDVLIQTGKVVNITVSKKVIQKVPEATVEVSLLWSLRLSLLGKTYKRRIKKTILFTRNSLTVDIICLRNCRHQYMLGVPGIFRAECYNCKKETEASIKYAWEIHNKGDIEIDGKLTKYLVLLENKHSTREPFLLSVNVTSEEPFKDERTNTTSKTTRYGYASMTLVPSKITKFLWLNTKMTRSTQDNHFDTFDFSVLPQPPLQAESTLPLVSFFRTAYNEIEKKVDVCSYVTPYTDLSLSQGLYGVALLGLRISGGLWKEHLEMLPPSTKIDREDYLSLATKCQQINDDKVGLTYIQALAQEIAIEPGLWTRVPPDVRQCYMTTIRYFERHPSTSSNSYFIHNLYLFAMQYIWTLEDFRTGVFRLEEARARIFHNTVKFTSELRDLTEYVLHGFTNLLVNALHGSELPNVHIRNEERYCLLGIEKAMMGLVQLSDQRGIWDFFDFPFGKVAGMWLDVLEAPEITLELTTFVVYVKLVIPKEVFIETLKEFDILYPSTEHRDSFVNIMVLATAENIHRNDGPPMQFGSVVLVTELKTTSRKIELKPSELPIILEFKQQRARRQYKGLKMEVIQSRGSIVDSTCLTIEVKRTDSSNITVNLNFPEGYIYSYAYMSARYQSEIVDFLDMPFKTFNGQTSHVVPKLSSVEIIDFPNSKALFMIRVEGHHTDNATGTGLGISGKAMGTGGNYTETTTIFGSVDVLVTQCFYYKDNIWRSDSACKAIPMLDPSSISCHCTIHAPYSARQKADSSMVEETSLQELHFYGPTILPGLIVGATMVMFVVYSYWAYFIDIKERDCAQIHVIKNMYDPNSIEQYLICISTGILPGAGTDNRVGFLLVGELGSLQYVIPEGTHAHTTGSEIWFMISSDLELGNIMGIYVQYDKYVSGAVLYPWLLKGVVLYCMRSNQVIVFNANQLMGLHLPTIVLPTVPHTFRYGEETRTRWWRLLRRYHSLGSVLFHMPGIGVTNVMSALGSMLAVMGTCAIAIEIVGAPFYMNHMHEMRVKQNYQEMLLRLAPISFLLIIAVKIIFNLVFRKSVGVLWYRRPPPHEEYWMSGAPSRFWLSLTVIETWRLKHRFFAIQTWISNKNNLIERRRRVRNSPIRNALEYKLYGPPGGSPTFFAGGSPTLPEGGTPTFPGITAAGKSFFSKIFSSARNSGKKSMQEPVGGEAEDETNESSSSGEEDDKNINRADERGDTPSSDDRSDKATWSLTSEGSETQTTSRKSVPTTSRVYEGSSTDTSEEVTEQVKWSQTSFEGQADLISPEMQQGVVAGEFKVLSSRTSSSSTASLENIATDASDEASTAAQGNSSHKPRVDCQKTKRYLSKRNARNSFVEKPLDQEGRVEGTGDMSIEPRHPLPPGSSPPFELSFRAAPNRPGFHLVKHPERLSVLRRDTQLNRWRITEKDKEWSKRGGRTKRQKMGFTGDSLQVPGRVMASSDALFSEEKGKSGSEGVVSFTDYYFKRVLVLEREEQQVSTASPLNTNFRFLRKSRYLEKMVRDYGLDDTIQSRRGKGDDVNKSSLPPELPSFSVDKEPTKCSAPHPGKENTLQFQRELWNTNVTRREMVGKLLKLNLESNRQDSKIFAASKRKLKTHDALFSSLRGVKGRNSEQTAPGASLLCWRKSKKTEPLTGKPNRCWLLKLCLQFEDSEGEDDASSLLCSKAVKLSKLHSLSSALENSPFHPPEYKPRSYSNKNVALSELGVGEPGNKFLPEPCDTTRVAIPSVHRVSLKRNRRHNLGDIAQCRRLGVDRPGLVNGTETDQSPHYSGSRGKPGGDTLATLKLRAQRFLKRFASHNSSSTADSPGTGTTWSPHKFPPPASSHHDNITRRRSAGAHRSLNLKRDVLDENRSAAQSSSSSSSKSLNPPEKPQGGISEDKSINLEPPATGDVGSDPKKDGAVDKDPQDEEESAPKRGPGVFGFVNYHLFSYTGICYLTYHFLSDFIRTFWHLKMYVIQIPVLALSVSCVILCSGWVLVNSRYYSFQESKDWVIIVLMTLILNFAVMEPLFYLLPAAIGTYIWETPQLISECLKRFKIVLGDLNMREFLVGIRLAGIHRTCFIHTQAAPESASLFNLHDRIFKALSRVTQLPHVTFSKDVYWLILYAACTIVLVNAQSDIFSQSSQKNHTRTRLEVPPVQSESTSVAKMWDYIIFTLLPGMLHLKSYHNITVSGDETQKLDLDPGSPYSLGTMVLAPMRIRQLRVQKLSPELQKARCVPLPVLKVDMERCGNFEYSLEMQDTSTYGVLDPSLPEGSILVDPFMHRETQENGLFSRVDALPRDGYWTTLHFDNIYTKEQLEQLRDSEWIDERTRYIFIDFALLNVGSSIASAFRITVEFKRPGPFWSTTDFHFRFEQPFWYHYLVYIVGGIFCILTAHNLIREILKMLRRGFWKYVSDIKSYIELSKVVLSCVVCYAYIQTQHILHVQLNVLRYGYLSRRTPEFVNFFEMANLDSLYKSAGGFLAFICIFQMFVMLSKIRRLLVFIRLLRTAVYLFLMPLITGLAFSFLAYILFGKTISDFSNPLTCYLMVNQFFIKPIKIYETLASVHPYLGPSFVFSLGFCINFFVVNFFIAFLNEAYSSIMSQVRLERYKLREKTRLEYVYEFLGIKSTQMWDKDEEQRFKEREIEKELIKSLKRIHTE